MGLAKPSHLPMLVSVLLLTRVGVSLVDAATQAQLYQLMDDLFTNYKPEVRPTTNGEPTSVYISIYLLSIQSLDEKSQVLETSVIVEADWLDDYLSWNTSAYGDVTYFMYPQKKIWLPDVVIENSVQSQRQLGYDENVVMVYSHGLVLWMPSQVIKTSCDIDVTYYPFDSQTCNIIISTWMSTKDDIDIDPDTKAHGLLLSRYSTSGTWQLVSNELELLPNENGLTRIQFKLNMKRLRTYYVLNIILPVLFLSFTASMVFFLPAEAGEKIGMGITVLLAYAVYLTIIADNMPQTSLQVSYLAVYLTLLLGLTAMGVVLAVVVLHIHHKTDDCKIGKRTEAVVRKLRKILRINRAKGETQTQGESENVCTNRHQQKEAGKNLNVYFGNIAFPHHKNAVAPLEEITDFSPPPSYREDEEDITWPKVAETVDRAVFITTSFLITAITLVFIPVLATASG